MYISKKFQETDRDTLYQLIRDHPLGTLITAANNEIAANHIPFYLNELTADKFTLQGHIAKVNPLWRQCAEEQQVLVVFQGPDAYISPNYYPSKKNTGKAVPTWNYSVVHVQGHINFKHENKWIFNLLEKLTHTHESASQRKPWSMNDAPGKYISSMINAVVGLEITVSTIVGKFKLSQNKADRDISGVINGLQRSTNPLEISVSEQMQTLRKNTD